MADSFADLWTSSAPKPKPQTLSAALSVQQQPLKPVQRQPPPKQDDATWAGLDSLSSGNWGFASTTSAIPSHSNSNNISLLDQSDPWATTSTIPAQPSSNMSLLDQSGGDDDILGMLSQPVEVVRSKKGEATKVQLDDTLIAPNPTPKPKPTSSRNSPPPHIVGKIVEMGFSLPQARKALSETDDGQNVQAAVEALLASGSTSGGQGFLSERISERLYTPPPRERSPPPRSRPPPKGQKERERERLERQQQLERPISSNAVNLTEMQGQADKLLSQASEIGLSVLSKANAFWKEGKGKVVKAYEERSNSPSEGSRGRGSGGLPARGGRPKWMDSNYADHEELDAHDQEIQNSYGFRYDEPINDQELHGGLKLNHQAEEIDLFASEPAAPQPSRKQEPTPSPPFASRQATPLRHSPPFRKTTPITKPTRNFPSATPSVLSLAVKHKASGMEQFKLGQYANAAASYTSAIEVLPLGHLLLVPLHTNRALARIRIGEYDGAVSDCEKAIGGIIGEDFVMFSANHPRRENDILGFEDALSNGGSNVDVKIKTYSTPPPLTLDQFPSSFLSTGRAKVNEGGWTHAQGVGVDLLDSYVKALRRAAEASEGREKWHDAELCWGVLANATWIDEKTRQEAARGGARCRKMLNPERPPVRAPAKVVKIQSTTSTGPSKALQALQSVAAQSEAEDNAKFALKDVIDKRLSSWCNGKEGNIRALLASLDSILWEGALTGIKMGMADLVTPAQVKKGYVKAIGRVHPDKLNASNSTLEQRMLANGIFGALNDGWIAFQGGQKY